MIIYCNDNLIGNNISEARDFKGKLIGLMGKRFLEDGEGLLLFNCSSIHCFFMKIPIDAVYLSKNMEIIWVETINPWKIGKILKNTCHVLELPAGFSNDILKIGEHLRIVEE